MKQFLLLALIFASACLACHDSSRIDKEHRVLVQTSTSEHDTSKSVGPSTEFNLRNRKKRFMLAPGVNIDFRNFVYDDFVLHNGVSYSDVEMGFDTVRHVKTLSFGDSLKLIQLYNHYAGGSSEIISLFYLYQREHDHLNLLSMLSCRGYYPMELMDSTFKVKADHYGNGQAPNCCPMYYEIGEFLITKDSLKYLSSEFYRLE